MKREFSFFDRTENIKLLWRGFIGVLVLLFLLDFFTKKHPSFPWEVIPGFNAVYGFISCAVFILVSKVLGYWLKKRENYYD